MRDRLARKCAEDEPAYPALVLGKAQLVSNPPQHDARKDAFFQHAKLHEPTDQKHRRVTRDAGPIEIECGDMDQPVFLHERRRVVR